MSSIDGCMSLQANATLRPDHSTCIAVCNPVEPMPDLAAAYLAALDALIQPIRAADLPTTLESMRALLRQLGDPQRSFPAIVIAGSTGKGSTAWGIAHGLRAAGHRVGLFTSPHLHSFRERFRVDDAPIALDVFIPYSERVRAAAAAAGVQPSTFEAATAIAFQWFADQHVDYAVLECGLGGRFDAVNTAHNVVLSLIMPIELEHAALLGGTLESIAWHETGIIRPFTLTLITTPLPPVSEVLLAEVKAQKARLRMVLSNPVDNALDLLSVPPPTTPPPTFPARLEAIARVRADGSTQTMIIDGGHTPKAARYVAEQIRRWYPGQPLRGIIGMLCDKDAAGYLAMFDQPGVTLQPIALSTRRALPPGALRAAYTPTAARWTADDAASIAAALDAVRNPLVLVGGSLRLAALTREALGLLDADALAEAIATRALFEGDAYDRKIRP